MLSLPSLHKLHTKLLLFHLDTSQAGQHEEDREDCADTVPAGDWQQGGWSLGGGPGQCLFSFFLSFFLLAVHVVYFFHMLHNFISAAHLSFSYAAFYSCYFFTNLNQHYDVNNSAHIFKLFSTHHPGLLPKHAFNISGTMVSISVFDLYEKCGSM